MDGITDSMDMSISKLQETVKDKEAWHAAVYEVSLISGSSAFSKTSLNIRKFTVHILLKPGLENFEHYFIFFSLFYLFFKFYFIFKFYIIEIGRAHV